MAVLLDSSAEKHADADRAAIESRLSSGEFFWLDLEDRGYYVELTPPILVDVLEGRIMGAQKHPTASYRYFRR